MTYAAAPAKNEIFGTPTNAAANAGFGKLWDFLIGLFGSTGNPEDVFDGLKMLDAYGLWNIRLSPSVGANALTGTLVGNDGAALAAGNPGYVHQRSSTLGSHQLVRRKLTAPAALIVSAGSTLGHTSGVPGFIFWYLLDNAGAPLVGVCGTYQGMTGIYTTVAEGGAGNADAANVMYASSAVASIAGRLIAITKDTQATAGTWAALPTETQNAPFDRPLDGLEEDLVPDIDNDYVETFDASAGKRKRAKLTTVSRITTTVRQCIQAAALDANGANAALGAGAGLRLALDASPTPLHLTYASGFSSGAALDYGEAISADSADITGSNLAASNTLYVYKDLAGAYGVTLIAPQYGDTFDRGQGSLLNFEGLNGSTTFIDDFGPTWTGSGNAQISTAQFKFGTSSLLLDGTGDFITTTDIKTLGEGSWEMSLWFRITALPTAGNRCTLISSNTGAFGVQLELFNNAGTTKMELALSSNGTSQDIAALVVGTNTVWTLNQQNKARLVFDAVSGTYKLYLSLNSAAESTDISVSSSARICALTQLRLGADSGGGAGWNGNIDAFRLLRCATNTSTETPSVTAPAIGDYKHHFFSIPKMQMFEVTGASAAAGQDPTMTPRTRLFLGEADTGAATVTAVRNYGLRGRFRDQRAFPGLNTITSINHNLGTNLVRVRNYGAIKTVQDTSGANFPVGALMPIYNTGGDLTVPRGGSNVAVQRNVLRITNDSAGGMKAGSQGASHVSFAPAFADLITEVERAF
jgi:hypothetical protein